jgi:Putative zinc-finger
MQELTPQQSRLLGNHPSDAGLAAYIDGALGKEEATQVMEHLASCESCFEVYSETLRFQLDSEPAPPQGKIVPFPRKDPIPVLWRAAAAVLIVGLSAIVSYRALLAPPPALVTAELAPPEIAEPLKNGPSLEKSFWLGPTDRGGGDEGGEIPVDPASFQIGVQFVNLQVSLEANDVTQVSDAMARILQVLDTQSGVKPLKEAYIALKSKIVKEGAPPLQVFMGEASQLNRETRVLLEELPLDLGQFVEAGRLSAIAQEPSFFQRGENREFLRKTIWRQRFKIDDMTIDPAALQSLKDISEVLDQDTLSSADYARLRQSFDRILEIYYPS